MSRNHIKIAMLFRHDPTCDEYFYHLKAKWNAGGETIVQDEWISITKEVYDLLRRDLWKESKRIDRTSRCRRDDGTRCMDDCEHCPNGKTVRDGLPLSLEQQMELGYMPEDSLNVEELIEAMELSEVLHVAIEQLGEKDQRIVKLYSQGFSERDIARVDGRCQKTINNRKGPIFSKLRADLEDYR